MKRTGGLVVVLVVVLLMVGVFSGVAVAQSPGEEPASIFGFFLDLLGFGEQEDEVDDPVDDEVDDSVEDEPGTDVSEDEEQPTDSRPGQDDVSDAVPWSDWEQRMADRGASVNVDPVGDRFDVTIMQDRATVQFEAVDPEWGNVPDVTTRRGHAGMDELVWVEDNAFGEDYAARIVFPGTYASVYRCDGDVDDPDCTTLSEQEDGDGERPYYRVENGQTVVYMDSFSGAGVVEVTDQADWNEGTFNGTSADRDDNSGNLGLGWLNGTNPASTGLENGLVAYWRLDGTGGDVLDYSGNAYHGTNEGATRGVDGVFGTNAFDFISNNDNVYAELDWDSRPTGSDPFAISMWVKPGPDAGDEFMGLISGRTFSGNPDHGVSMGFRDDGRLYFDIYSDGTGGQDHRAPVIYDCRDPNVCDWDTDAWYLFVGQWDGTDGNDALDLYVNGTTEHATGDSGVHTISWDNIAEDEWGLGRDMNREDFPFDGKISDVRIYDRTLSEDEIEQLYLNGMDGTFEGDYTSDVIDPGESVGWNSLGLDVLTDTGNTEVSAVFEALDASENVVGSEVISLSQGSQVHTLDVPESEKARVIFNGTSTSEEETWEIDAYNVSYGDWSECQFSSTGDTVIDSDCMVSGTETAAGNVEVVGNSIINVTSTGDLGIDFTTYYLNVTEGSGVFITDGGVLTQRVRTSLLWSTQSDWDAAQSREGVVTRAVGNSDQDTIKIGYDPNHGVPSEFDHYWTFDEASEYWMDEVGNANLSDVAPLGGSPTRTGFSTEEPGVAGEYSIWTDRDELVEYGGMPIDPTDDWTLGWWVYYNESMSDFRQGFVLDDSSGSESVGLGTSDMDFKIGSVGRTPGTGQSLNTGQWYFKVLTYDATGDTLTGYVDGDLDYSVDPSGDGSWLNDIDVIRFGDREAGTGTGVIARHDSGFLMQDMLSASQISDLDKIRSQGNLTTGKQSAGGEVVELNTDATVPSGTSITITVNQDTNSDGTADNTESVSIGDGMNTYGLSNFADTSADIWLDIDLATNDIETAPELHSAELN